MCKYNRKGDVNRESIDIKEERIPKQVLFGKLDEGENSRGRPKKNWLNCLAEDCEKVGVSYGSWINKALDRKRWRNSLLTLTSKWKK